MTVRSTLDAIRRRHGPDLLAVAIVFVVYTLTIWAAYQSSFTFAVATGAGNTVPVVICGVIARRIIVRSLMGRRTLVQAIGHAVLCVLFSLTAYWMLIVVLAVVTSRSPWNFVVRNWVVRGMSWQLLENVTTYGALAALTYARAPKPALEPVAAGPVAATAPFPKEPSRYLTRIGDELRPIDLDRIVSIEGADDYAELSTLDGKRLVSMTLSEFEATLDPARFVRVHRSRIINLDHVERAEPAGDGRLLLQMRNGSKVATSRTGARAIKSRVI
jgi:two-component system, LytTR family, response regulator